MMTRAEVEAIDPQASLEKALIEEYLAERGCTRQSVNTLPPPDRESLLRGAAAFATLKLAQIEARAPFVHEMD